MLTVPHRRARIGGGDPDGAGRSAGGSGRFGRGVVYGVLEAGMAKTDTLVFLDADVRIHADGLERGIEAIQADANASAPRPKVYFEEWDDPQISGIRWVSELISIAGRNRPSASSTTQTPSAAQAAGPTSRSSCSWAR